MNDEATSDDQNDTSAPATYYEVYIRRVNDLVDVFGFDEKPHIEYYSNGHLLLRTTSKDLFISIHDVKSIWIAPTNE